MRRKLASLLTALALLCSLSACKGPDTAAPEPRPEPPQAEAPSVEPQKAAEPAPAVSAAAPDEAREKAEPEPAASAPLDNRALIESLGLDEDAVLRAVRRAAVRSFDAEREAYPHDAWFREGYYSANLQPGDGWEDWPCGELFQRAARARELSLDDVRLYPSIEIPGALRCAIPATELDWALDLPVPDGGAEKKAHDAFVTASLSGDRVSLTFEDSEEARQTLLGGDAPGALALGPDHPYEVQGLFSHYADLFLWNLSDGDPLGGSAGGYAPYLFLITDRGGLEMVNVSDCLRYGVFCAMPIPGVFAKESLAACTESDAPHLIEDRDGMVVDLAEWAASARNLPLYGLWAAALDEVQAEGGSYAVMGNLTFYGSSLEFSATELDIETDSGWGALSPLGMTGEGVVCGYRYCCAGDRPDSTGALVLNARTEELEEIGSIDRLEIKVLSGAPAFGRAGEAILYDYIGYFSGPEEP